MDKTDIILEQLEKRELTLRNICLNCKINKNSGYVLGFGFVCDECFKKLKNGIKKIRS